MPIQYQPKPRTVVYCDFTGFIAPEIIKRRPVIVLHAHKRNSKLVAVVPLSTTAPHSAGPHHYRLKESPWSDASASEVWAKCDMVAVVSIERLDFLRSGRRRADGKREYLMPKIGAEQFDAVRRGVASGLGLTALPIRHSIPSVPARGFQDSGDTELDPESDDKLPDP